MAWNEKGHSCPEQYVMIRQHHSQNLDRTHERLDRLVFVSLFISRHNIC